MRTLLIAAALLLTTSAGVARADVRTRHERLWPGVAWAVPPAAFDWHMTSRCLDSGACAEASFVGGTRAWSAVTLTVSVAVQSWVDLELRQRGHRWAAWLLRGAGVLWHGYLGLHAHRLEQQWGIHP